ncbi:HET-domain-containing protein [Lophiostoma macrostomum CBS 122681]|uniref:HET-domain-containing protein n=1 Tax=Lophiostoma macrostomum CBS 122681 TaxID=1314788 RepID=A0A6A6SUR4_9PLEO|nr:HET-domain-containing protein [Lophiostoma macrostomum CBS 122681]
MATCRRCAAIEFDDGCIHALGSVQFMINSARAGCAGCQFFLGTADVTDEPELQAILQQCGNGQNGVNLVFLRLDEDHGFENVLEIELRICSIYGVDAALPAVYEEDENEHPQRLIAENPADEDSIDLVRGWFKRCTQHHGRSCALNTNAELPTRLIYVPASDKEPIKLCDTRGQTGQYVTLSYCWGKGKICTSTSLNLSARSKAIPVSELSKTFQDAVDLVRRMGLQWLWIDSLCILQDEDLQDWNRESARMAQVYGNSALTICVDLAGDVNEGIYQVGDEPDCYAFGPDKNRWLQTATEGWSAMTKQALYRRGWALQERLLSVRNIHFLETEMAWECNTAIYLESSPNKAQSPLGFHFGKSIYTKYLHQQLVTPISKASHEDILARISVWNLVVVQEMSVRYFTFESDRLPAVSGLSSALQIPEMGEYFAGVWSYNPFLSMTWCVTGRVGDGGTYYAPSWSWASLSALTPSAHETCVSGKSETEISDWEAWDQQFGPRLIDKKMFYKGSDRRGEVLEGSFITVAGRYRTVYVAERLGEKDQEWYIIRHNEEGVNELGLTVRVDGDTEYSKFDASFIEDWTDLEPMNRGEAKKYICMQIARERKRKEQNPKVLALVLEEVHGNDDTFRRIAILACDEPEADDDGWGTMTLKLV